MSEKLDDLYMKIVQANIVKKSDDESTETKPPQFAPPPAQPAASPTVPTAPTVVKPAKPTAVPKTDEQKKKEEKEEADRKLANPAAQPEQPNKPPEANKIASNDLLGLISLGIKEIVTAYAATTIYYMNPKTKKAVLERIGGKQVVIKFAGSNENFPAIIDEDTYDHYVKAGLETIYVPLSKDESFFTFTVKNAAQSTSADMLGALKSIRSSGYISGFELVQNSSRLDVVCKLGKHQETTELPQIIAEAVMDMNGVTVELPDLNRLCLIPESVFRKSTSLIQTI